MTTPADRKTAIAHALNRLLETGDSHTLGHLLTEDFVHRRPDGAAASKAEWLAAVQAALVPLTGMRVQIDHLLADGEHVVLHSRRRLPGDGPAIAVVDIWRFEGDRVAEAWELIEPLDQAAAHMNWWEPAPI